MAEVLIGLIAEFDDRASEEMESIQRALLDAGIVGRQTRDVPYHITLGLYPDEKETEELLIRLVEENSGKLKAFPITFQHIGLFGLDVLFFGPDTNHELLNLHERFSLRPDPRWSPHATLLMDDPEVILRALPIVAERFTGFEATVERVSLYSFRPSKLLRQCAFI